MIEVGFDIIQVVSNIIQVVSNIVQVTSDMMQMRTSMIQLRPNMIQVGSPLIQIHSDQIFIIIPTHAPRSHNPLKIYKNLVLMNNQTFTPHQTSNICNWLSARALLHRQF